MQVAASMWVGALAPGTPTVLQLMPDGSLTLALEGVSPTPFADTLYAPPPPAQTLGP